MKFKLVLFSFLVATCVARPSVPFDEYEGFENLNMVTVPPNCPAGQQYINGQCRDVWRIKVVDIETQNTVTVPPNCPAGQEYVNGQCRDVWRVNVVDMELETLNIVTVPPNCPLGQEYINGQCRDVWIKNTHNDDTPQIVDCNPRQLRVNGKCLDLLRMDDVESEITVAGDEYVDELHNRNVISLPNHKCPDGYKPDNNGVCREIFD